MTLALGNFEAILEVSLMQEGVKTGANLVLFCTFSTGDIGQ